MKYLITGGAGFIGSSLASELVKENEVVIIDNFCDYYSKSIKKKNISALNKKLKVYEKDILNFDELSIIFKKEKFDFIIHLAGQPGVRNSITNPFKYIETNCMGTLNILELAHKYHVKNIILASSSSIYGNLNTPFIEDEKTDEPLNVYSASKKSAELLSHAYHNLYDFNIINLRFFTVYGPKQRPDLAISKFTKLMLENKEITLYGDGFTKRDYTYIDDIINGIKLSIDYILNNENVYEILNIGSNNPISLQDMVNTIAKELNVKPKIKYLPYQKGEAQITYADITKAKNLIGYSPKVSFNDGIKKFIKWYKNNE